MSKMSKRQARNSQDWNSRWRNKIDPKTPPKGGPKKQGAKKVANDACLREDMPSHPLSLPLGGVVHELAEAIRLTLTHAHYPHCHCAERLTNECDKRRLEEAFQRYAALYPEHSEIRSQGPSANGE